MSRKTSPIGRRFVRFIVQRELEPRLLPCGQKVRQFECLCDCGTIFTVRLGCLNSGHTQSCGCLQKERASRAKRTHGHTVNGHSPTYTSWAGMNTRCHNPNVPSFKTYGAENKLVGDSWRGPSGFDVFLAEMGERPPGKTLHRLNNDLGYFKENCVWATPAEQARLTRQNVVLTIKGVTACVTDLCAHFGLNYNRVKMRLWLGWKPEVAFFAPRGHKPQPSDYL